MGRHQRLRMAETVLRLPQGGQRPQGAHPPHAKCSPLGHHSHYLRRGRQCRTSRGPHPFQGLRQRSFPGNACYPYPCSVPPPHLPHSRAHQWHPMTCSCHDRTAGRKEWATAFYCARGYKGRFAVGSPDHTTARAIKRRRLRQRRKNVRYTFYPFYF